MCKFFSYNYANIDADEHVRGCGIFLRACTCEDARTCDDREINSIKSQCTRRQSGYASSIAVILCAGCARSGKP